jgi:glyoxylase-like metal-dependent hydrolase (beta-lactamase superfamily II)
MMWLFSLVLFATSEENLQDAQKRLTESRLSITFNSYNAGASGQLASSHVLVSNETTMLVDAQLQDKDTGRLVKLIQSIGKPLVTVFLTSERPEHTGGLALIRAAYPEAKIFAPAAFAKKVGAEPYTAKTLDFAGEKLEIVPLQRGGKDTAVALFVPTLHVLVAGDLLWLQAPEDLGLDHKAWKARLYTLRKGRTIDTVLGGHSDAGPATLLDDMAKKL